MLLDGAVVHLPDVFADAEYTFLDAARKANYRTFLGAPLMRDDAAIGVLVMCTDGLTRLGGLASVNTQFTLEERASGLARRISDTTLLGIALLAVATVGTVTTLRARDHRTTRLPADRHATEDGEQQ